MSFGLTTWKADGTPVITAQGAGGVYVELLSRAPGAGVLTKSYPGEVGMQLRIYQVQAGAYTWVTGIGGDGIPYITLTPRPPTNLDGPAALMVFAE